MTYIPVEQRVWDALVDRLEAELPSRCEQVGYPCPQVGLRSGLQITVDTVYVAYRGYEISGRAHEWVDYLLRFDLEIWAFSADPRALIRRSLCYSWAVRHILQTDRYLNETYDKLILSDSDADLLAEVEGGVLVHGVLIPVQVKVRVPQPEEPE